MNPVTDDTVIDIANRWPRPVPSAPRQRVDVTRIVRGIVEGLGWFVLFGIFLQWTG